MKKKLLVIIMIFSLFLISCSTVKDEKTETNEESTTIEETKEEKKEEPKETTEEEKKEENKEESKEEKTEAVKPEAVIEMENGDTIDIVLLPEIAPNTVNNFISLSQKGFYDGLTFHRVIKDFMIQAGCPKGNGTGGPGYTIKDEFVSKSGYMLPHLRGVLSMAKTAAPDSAGSQFFIMHKEAEHLNGSYSAFGFVKNDRSLEVVDKIANVKTDSRDMPLDPVVIKKITINLNGYEFTEPEKIGE